MLILKANCKRLGKLFNLCKILKVQNHLEYTYKGIKSQTRKLPTNIKIGSPLGR